MSVEGEGEKSGARKFNWGMMLGVLGCRKGDLGLS